MGPVGILGSHPDLSCELRAARGRGERTRFERLTALTPLKTEVLLGGCYTVPDEGYAKPEATNMTTPDAGPHAADAVIIAQTGAAGEVQTRLRTGCVAMRFVYRRRCGVCGHVVSYTPEAPHHALYAPNLTKPRRVYARSPASTRT